MDGPWEATHRRAVVFSQQSREQVRFTYAIEDACSLRVTNDG
jgi:hypothetical protein